MPRIVEKATAKMAVPGVRSKRIVPDDAAGLVGEDDHDRTEHQADHAADEADDGRLGHQLADDPSSRAADGALDPDLARPLRDRHRHRVDDRQATDHQADDGDADDDRVEDAVVESDLLVELGAGERLDVVDLPSI